MYEEICTSHLFISLFFLKYKICFECSFKKKKKKRVNNCNKNTKGKISFKIEIYENIEGSIFTNRS